MEQKFAACSMQTVHQPQAGTAATGNHQPNSGGVACGALPGMAAGLSNQSPNMSYNEDLL